MNSEAQARRSEQENEEETLVNRQPANQSSAGSPDYLQSNQPGLKQEPDSQKYGVELKYRSVKNVSAGKLAAGLGYFSIALGLAELLAPAQLGEIIGLDKKHRALSPTARLAGDSARRRYSQPAEADRRRHVPDRGRCHRFSVSRLRLYVGEYRQKQARGGDRSRSRSRGFRRDVRQAVEQSGLGR